jgi:hypothetical protein
VLGPEDSQKPDPIEMIMQLVPNSKIENMGGDRIAVRFKSSDDELERIIKTLKSVPGVLEVDRR